MGAYKWYFTALKITLLGIICKKKNHSYGVLTWTALNMLHQNTLKF